MLTKLFSSPVRVKILKFLVMHAPTEFSAADIAAKTKSVVRSVNKEMGKLVETGAVAEETKPETLHHKTMPVKHYRANQDFILFNEIKNLFVKLQILDLDGFKGKMQNLSGLNYGVLTGRFVGDSGGEVDLLLVGRADNKRLEKIITDFEHTLGWEINWVLMELEEYDYRQKIGDMFLTALLGGPKIEIMRKFV